MPPRQVALSEHDYNLLRETRDTTIAINTKLDNEIEERKDHEKRIRLLEAYKNKAAGVVALSGLMGAAAGWATSVFGWFKT